MSYTNYARVQASWNAATTAGITNNGVHTFAAVDSSITVTHIGLWDASSGGNFLYNIPVTSTLFASGSAPKILDEGVTLTPGSAYSNYLIPLIADHLTGRAAMTFDSSVFLALYSSNPGAGDTGNEIAVGSYARQQIEFDAPASGATDNTNEENFPTATADIPEITHLAIKSAVTSGNLLLFGALTSSIDPANGDDYRAEAGAIDFSI